MSKMFCYTGIVLTLILISGHAVYCDEICDQPIQFGLPCEKSDDTKAVTRYYYSQTNLVCSPFPYAGCGGNENNFGTEEECLNKCGNRQNPDVTKIHSARHQNKCFYQGEFYDIEEEIKLENVPRCTPSCYCGQGFPELYPKITCAQVDCPAIPKLPKKLEPPNCGPGFEPGVCIPLYDERRTCCPTDFFCCDGNKQTKPKLQCRYKDKSYLDGQIIDQKEYPCLSCICNQNFTGKLTSDICSEVNCGVLLHYQDQVTRNCAPKYYTTTAGQKSCCPIGWDCLEN